MLNDVNTNILTFRTIIQAKMGKEPIQEPAQAPVPIIIPTPTPLSSPEEDVGEVPLEEPDHFD